MLNRQVTDLDGMVTSLDGGVTELDGAARLPKLPRATSWKRRDLHVGPRREGRARRLRREADPERAGRTRRQRDVPGLAGGGLEWPPG